MTVYKPRRLPRDVSPSVIAVLGIPRSISRSKQKQPHLKPS